MKNVAAQQSLLAAETLKREAQTEAFLFSVLRNELWGEPLSLATLSHTALQQLLLQARRQTVEGLVAGVLMRGNVQLEREDALLVFSRARMIEQLNHKANRVLIALENVLGAEGIEHLVFKGQTLARLYPHPTERTPGDIDFYCPPTCFRRAVEVLKTQWQVDINEGESQQHHEFSYQDVPLEMHFCMIKFNHSGIQRYWNRLLDSSPRSQTEIDGVCIPTLCPTVNVLYTFLHLYHHLVELGVGLRQFCDLLCLLHHFRTEIDRDALALHLEKMGFRRAFGAVGWILVHRLGLPEEEFPLPLPAKAQRYEKAILDIVFNGGNFGKYISQTAVRSGMRYNIEATVRKFKHYGLFWRLSCREIVATILKEIPNKMLMQIKRPF